MLSKKDLYKSPVVFEPWGHTYTLNGKTLKGVTSMLKDCIFHDKYALPKQKAIESHKAFEGYILEDTFVNAKAPSGELESVSKETLDFMFRDKFESEFEYADFIHKLQDAQGEFKFMRTKLEGASERGSGIHGAIEMADSWWAQNRARESAGEEISFEDLAKQEPTNEMAKAYRKLITEKKLVPIANEYCVSNEETHASMVDIVLCEEDGCDNEVILADVKCTSKLDEEYLSWQLSVYKVFFEIFNPTIKVKKLMGIWLPREQYGKPKIIDIKEKSFDDVMALINADNKKKSFVPKEEKKELAEEGGELAVQVQDITQVFKVLKSVEEKKKQLTDYILQLMEQGNIKKFENDEIVITRTEPTTKQSFDSKTFASEHKDLYEKYLKESEVKGSVRIKLK